MSTDSKWAVLTGASSGIGKALAFEFAAGGFNLFLTGRNEVVLAEVAAECVGRHSVETEVVPADLSTGEGVESLVAALGSKPYTYEVLVNNAGFGIQGPFASTSIDENIDLLNVQLTAALTLTRTVLPAMISRGRGRLLFVASVYSFSPVPLQSVYAASKAFLLSFSSSLANELRETGVTVTVFCPGVTQTEFRSRAGISGRNSRSGMTAETAGRVAYIETLRGTHIVVPGFFNRIFVVVVQLLPQSWVPALVRFINRRRGQGLV